MNGSLVILNAGAGDIELTFNQHDTAEREKALRLLKEMQVRGYAILVREEDGTYSRARGVDVARGKYILQAPALEGAVVDAEVVEPKALPPGAATGLDNGVPKKRKLTHAERSAKMKAAWAKRREVDVTKAHAVGIARSAGG